MGKVAVCPKCGKEFDKSDSKWTHKLNNHAEKEHGEVFDDKYPPRKNKLKEAGVKIVESEDREGQDDQETQNSKEPVDLIEKDIRNAEPKKGIFKRKPYGSEEPEQEKSEEVELPSQEVEDEPSRASGGYDLFGITENLDQAKKWGGRALIAGAIAIALFVSFRTYSQVNEVIDKDNQVQSESSTGEGDNGGNGNIERNPEPNQEKLDTKDNGHKEPEQIYFTSEDL